MSKKLFSPKLIVMLGVVGVSLSAIFVRYADMPAMALACWRMAFSTLLLLPSILFKFRGELSRLPLKSIMGCLLSGVFLAGHFSAYFEAVYHTSVAASTVLVDMEAFFVILISWCIWRTTVPRRGLLAICLAFMGSVVVALVGGGDTGTLYGNLMALLGAFFVAGYTIIGSRQRANVSTTVYTFLVYFSATVTLVVACLITGTPLTGYPVQGPVMGLAMAVFCTLLGHSVFSWSLKYVDTAFVSTAKLGEPVFATILALILFQEVPGLAAVLGGIVVLGGIYLYATVADSSPAVKSTP